MTSAIKVILTNMDDDIFHIDPLLGLTSKRKSLTLGPNYGLIIAKGSLKHFLMLTS